MKFLRFPTLMFLLLLAGMSSCVKDKFDEPPFDGEDPNMEANITIAQLKLMYTGELMRMDTDLIIKGVVIADDRSGNFYKTLIIQDETAGIALRLDGTNLYNDYPIGRRLFVKLNGLVMGDYNNLLQIGGYIDSTQSPAELAELPINLAGQHVFKGKYNVQVEPIVVTIPQLLADVNGYQNRLIRLDSVEVKSSELGLTYADGVNKISYNRTIKDCNGSTIIVRNSGYSLFANQPLPGGRGNMTAVMSVYGSDAQLLIRDTTDMPFYGERCGGGNPMISIGALRTTFTGTATTAPDGKKIKGIVISDRSFTNVDSKNMYIQDSTGGIVVRFTAAHSFNVGDEVEVDVSGLELSEYRSLLQVNNVPLTNAVKTGTGTISPQVVTVSGLSEARESTLVTILGATLSGNSGNYSGSVTLTDATGTTTLYTYSSASFSATAYPSGSRNITCIISQFNNRQVLIRSPADIQ